MIDFISDAFFSLLLAPSFLVVPAALVLIVIDVICKKYRHIPYDATSLFLSVAVSLAWVSGMGWFRLFFGVIPLAHMAVLLVVLHFVAPVARRKILPNVCLGLSAFSCAMMYAFLPDFGDVGPAYLLFGLVKTKHAFAIGLSCSILFALMHVVYGVISLMQIYKLRGQHKIEQFG